MAYATQDQVLNFLQSGDQSQGPSQVGSSGGGGLVGGASSPSSQPSGAQPGTGGNNQWTNIQSYLGANQGQNSQRANAIGQAGQSILDKEKSAFTAKKDETIGAAKKAAEPVTSLGTDKASQLIQQAAQSGQGSEQYTQAVNPLKQAYTAQYSGPTSFAYGKSADYTNLAKQAGDEQQFKNFLSQFDRNAQGGRELSTGQKALQSQLDVVNPELEAKRQAIADAAKSVGSEIDTGAQDVGSELSGIQNQFQTGKQSLMDLFAKQKTSSKADIDKAANDLNANNAATIAAVNAERDRIASLSKDQNSRFVRGVKNGKTSDYAINKADYYGYDPGDMATAANVGGVDTQRNVYNTISDIYGTKDDMIAKAASEARAAKAKDAEAAFQAAIQNKKDQLANQGYGNISDWMWRK